MHRRICLSILHAVFGIVFELPLKHATKTFTISSVLFLVAMIAMSHSAFAQESIISDPLKDLSDNPGIPSLTLKIKDGSTSTWLRRSTTDDPGIYLLRIPSLENYTIPVSKPENESVLGFDVNAISGRMSYQTLNFWMSPEIEFMCRLDLPKPVLSWDTGAGKSYLIPALEIPVFILALNGFDRLLFGSEVEDGKKVYRTNPSTFWDNLTHGRWRSDKDAFHVNQIEHPYQGSIYHGFARSAGLNFWESLGYTFVGSFLWETAGETLHPSINDQVASGIAGSFFGEALFRMASLLLEGGGGEPGFWRELGAAVLSPPTAFNRLVFGDRFKPVFPSRNPAIFQWVRLGAGLVVSNGTGSSITNRPQASLNYSISYGLPGQPSYSYTRPFDYFQFEITAATRPNKIIGNITVQGLLLGTKYKAGEAYRGVWGLYGGFDYISPPFFRVSSATASLGTTAQWWLATSVALQGTALAGIGLGAGGTVPGRGEPDYHYGGTGRGVLDLRLIFGDVAMLNLTGHGYYISSLGSSEPQGKEDIRRLETGLTVRIYRHHALGIQYTALHRGARYSQRANITQRLGTLGLVYTLLGDTRFGAVEWRDGRSP